MPKITMLTPITRPTPPSGNRNAMGAPTSTNTTQAIEIANFLCSSTAAVLTMRWLSRMRTFALSMEPESVTGIWRETPGTPVGITPGSTLSGGGRFVSTGTTMACTGFGVVSWVTGTWPASSVAAYRVGTSSAWTLAAACLERIVRSQNVRPSDALGERGAAAPGVALNIEIDEMSGGLAGLPVSASFVTATNAARRSLRAFVYSASKRATSFCSSQTVISRSRLYESERVSSSWFATPSTRTKFRSKAAR